MLAAPPQDVREVSLLMHLSGLRFGGEDARSAEALVALAEQERPDVVLASGGLTLRARAEEFAAARRFVARLAAPYALVMPGSDDIVRWDLPRRLFAPYAAFRAAFGPELQPRLASPQAWIACLRTTRRWKVRDGALSREQVAEVARWLQQAPDDALRIVALPHAPGQWRAQVTWALQQWQSAGVQLVLTGPGSRPALLPQSRAPGDTPVPTLWVAPAGPALARPVTDARPAPHSVNLVRRGLGRSWRLERWDLAPDQSSFTRRHWQEVQDARPL